ncbi:MAG: hypothetical protein Q9213_007062 [Squamulea squamosa]
MHKLGWGENSTVWLAKDQVQSRYTAIKLSTSEISEGNHEAQVLLRLSQGPASHPGKRHVPQLLDHFEHVGPNGTHSCLVMELLGPDVLSEEEEFEGDEYTDINEAEQITFVVTDIRSRLPGPVAWEACKQTTQALEYIHANGVAHGDLRPSKLLFKPSRVNYLNDSGILKVLDHPETGKIGAKYGYTDLWRAPKYLVASTSMLSPVGNCGGYTTKLIGYDSACLIGQKRENRSPLMYRAPEAVMTPFWGMQADIWSLACTMMELITGVPAFSAKDTNDILREWVDITCRPLPAEWGYLCSSQWVEGLPEVDEKRSRLHARLHDEYFGAVIEPEFAEAHIEMLGDLLQMMFRFRPEERPTVSELLKHPWLEKNPWH